MHWLMCLCFFVFFNDTATTEIYTLSLHDALPIYSALNGRSPAGTDIGGGQGGAANRCARAPGSWAAAGAGSSRRASRSPGGGRKSTRLNSSHAHISYAVFCFEKKKITVTDT